MTITDWLYLITTVVCYILAIIAGVYTKEKAKINKTTAAGKAMDVVGQLAAYAVHETEHLGLDNEQKREVAAQIITQGLSHLGVKNVTANVVNGAIEKAVNAMHLANVPESEVLSPVDQLKLQDTQPTEPALPVDMNAGDKNASR